MLIDDLAIPEMKLVQNTGGDEAKQAGALHGQFYCGITQEVIPDTGFDIVVMRPAQKTRTYWGRADLGDEPPVCASNDGITSINGDECKTACPYNAYNDAPYMLEATERRMKCLPNYNVMGIKLDSMMPILIRCSGISALAAKELNTLLRFHKNVRGQFFKAKLRVSSIKKKTASGEAYAIKFGQPELIQDEAVILELKSAMSELSNVELPELVAGEEPVQIPQEAAKAIPAAPPEPAPSTTGTINLDF
jgi:hypothetical protein